MLSWLRSGSHRTNMSDRSKSDRVKILEIDSLFLTPGGEIRFTDSRGRQNYHDLTHLSGNGADQVKEQLRRELSALLYAGQK